jgi:hypothetical protein
MHDGFARRPDSGERPGATVAVDLEEFVTFHREYGRLTPDVGRWRSVRGIMKSSRPWSLTGSRVLRACDSEHRASPSRRIVSRETTWLCARVLSARGLHYPRAVTHVRRSLTFGMGGTKS